METIWHELNAAAVRLTEATPIPDARHLMFAMAAGLLLVMWRRTWIGVKKAIVVAHEGGHAAAAVVTRRTLLRVHINPDGSGTTHTWGKPEGLGATLVTFAGYPFPGILGAGLIVAAVSGNARMWASVISIALLLLLWQTRTVHGWLVVGLCLMAVGSAAWFLAGGELVLGMAALGAVLLGGAARDLLAERRVRWVARPVTDVAALSDRGRVSAGIWWAAMVAVVLGSGWLAWLQVAQVYSLA